MKEILGDWNIYVVGNTVVVVLFRTELGFVLFIDSQKITGSPVRIDTINCVRMDFSFRHVEKSNVYSNNTKLSTRLSIDIHMHTVYTYMD